MSTISDNKTSTGIWKNGQVVLDSPVNWPEGCRVVLTLQEPQGEERLGITEEEWPRTPEALAEWLKWLDSIEPFEITPEDEAELQAARQAVKQYTITKMQERFSENES